MTIESMKKRAERGGLGKSGDVLRTRGKMCQDMGIAVGETSGNTKRKRVREPAKVMGVP